MATQLWRHVCSSSPGVKVTWRGSARLDPTNNSLRRYESLIVVELAVISGPVYSSRLTLSWVAVSCPFTVTGEVYVPAVCPWHGGIGSLDKLQSEPNSQSTG